MVLVLRTTTTPCRSHVRLGQLTTVLKSLWLDKRIGTLEHPREVHLHVVLCGGVRSHVDVRDRP